jgi:hypothetical protein
MFWNYTKSGMLRFRLGYTKMKCLKSYMPVVHVLYSTCTLLECFEITPNQECLDSATPNQMLRNHACQLCNVLNL